jgi:hypothetical protein
MTDIPKKGKGEAHHLHRCPRCEEDFAGYAPSCDYRAHDLTTTTPAWCGSCVAKLFNERAGNE